MVFFVYSEHGWKFIFREFFVGILAVIVMGPVYSAIMIVFRLNYREVINANETFLQVLAYIFGVLASIAFGIVLILDEWLLEKKLDKMSRDKSDYKIY